MVSGFPNWSRKCSNGAPLEVILLSIYQYGVESCADLSAGVIGRKDAHVIQEKFVYDRSQHTNRDKCGG